MEDAAVEYRQLKYQMYRRADYPIHHRDLQHSLHILNQNHRYPIKRVRICSAYGMDMEKEKPSEQQMPFAQPHPG